jgi:DNA polymerase-1
MKEELVSQIHVVHETVKKFGIQVFEKAGYEADDVIGTIVEKVSNQQASCDRRQVAGDKFQAKHSSNTSNTSDTSTTSSLINQVIIVTGDRDILQLVHDENVLVYMPVKGLSEAKLYGEKEVVERLGVLPNKIADWKGLAGDSSDNYPGVPGIGPKTATDLVNMYGSIEQIYTELENGNTNIKPRVAEKLLAGKESAYLSKNLATIRRDAPIEFNETSCAVSSFDTEEIRGILTELGFPSLVKRIQKNEVKEEKKTSANTQSAKSNNNDSGQLDLF